MPSHPDRVRRQYAPDSTFPLEVPDTELDLDDLPLDEGDELAGDETEERE